MKRVWIAAALFLVCQCASGQTLFVSVGNYSAIQSAIDDAADDDVIIVDPNIYYENIDFSGKSIIVRSTDPNDVNIVETTVIDGSGEADPNYNSVVTFKSGEDSNSVLSGFTITGGTGSWLEVYWEYKGYLWNRCGGGVICYNSSSPAIRKNVFVGNTAGQGGGIYFYDHSDPIIANNTFRNNTALIDSNFSDPDANDPNLYDHGDGGAIVGFQYCDATITGNLIENNSAEFYGGGIHLRQWSDGLIQDNHIINNDSRLGAGIHITYTSSPIVRGNLIEFNTAGNLGGGGIYIYNESKPIIERNMIINNTSTNGAGIAVKYSSAPTIRNNIISDNIDGAGIDCTGSDPNIYHNTIMHSSPLWRPGGIYCIGNSSPTIEHNIIVSNTSCYGIYIGPSVNPTIRYNNLWDNEWGNYGPNIADLTGTGGNISADPELISEPNGAVHLYYASGCIGAGDPNFAPGVGEFDFDGNPRVLNSRTDIGADEARPVWNLTNQSQYTSLQSAIDDSSDGQVIVATPGRYFENITISSKAIQLRSVDIDNWDAIGKTVIDGNNADLATVIFAGSEDANCILAGFTITGAANSGSGGGISGNGTAATIKRCHIADNTASGGAGVYDCDGLISNCRIADNISSTAGGGLYGCDGEIYSCFIVENDATTSGGGLYDCNAFIVNNTITENNSGISGGGAELCQNQIANCIIWGNTAPDNPGLKLCSEPIYSCLQSSGSGQGNIYTDPEFVDPNNTDYHLTVYSDCIDAGDNNSLSEGASTDVDGESRVFSFGANGTDIVDIGADEVISKEADFDGDGGIDYSDVSVITGHWLMSGADLPCDLTSDSNVDFFDYGLFAKEWPWEAPWHSAEREAGLEFDSSSDGYVKIGTPQGCELNNVYTFSYTAWVYPLVLHESNTRIIGKNERAFMISLGGKLVGYSNCQPSAYSSSNIQILKVGRWHFIVMTYELTGDRKVHLYADGKEVGYQMQTTGGTSPLPDWRAEDEWNLMIGSMAWYPGVCVPDAVIDEVAIYDRVLTGDEIEYLYNSGFGRPTPLWMNPIGLWRLDEAAGSIVIDSSVNANHGQLQGALPPVWTTGRFLSY